MRTRPVVAAIGAVVFVAVIPLAGRALDLYGSRIVLMAGAVCTAAGLALLGGTLASLPLALLSMVVAGVGLGALLGAPTRYIIIGEVPANMRATAVGLLSIFLIMGQILGGSLAGGVVGTSISNPQAYRALYLIFRRRVARDVRYEPAGAARARALADQHGLIGINLKSDKNCRRRRSVPWI